ncbi:hypothetical protein Kisp01_26260 [Kineosporia sp. NBRC 101677]|uniref:GNAT family N-acetyltransferase n=1 Tax=Kineosporia sp. NBRC 101677 TaxID=3032197 RepID=UPI0024A0C8BB|nr:GNAT family N-acetyltransferase [Kineosporia sp. NBRC 101677]GLY15611.1 hypothetical protein Kisp01_26260 [Kineosporia sp. NBRC 101677]
MSDHLALTSERLLFPLTRELAADDPSIGKALLAHTGEPPPVAKQLTLKQISSPADWRLYEELRIEVEAGFGVPPPQARTIVAVLRQRTAILRLAMYFGHTTEDGVVGSIGHFGESGWARLQEVDIFPAWRGQGLGDALLAATLHQLHADGVNTVIVGADEDDWPLSWYRRRGFTDVARVTLTR